MTTYLGTIVADFKTALATKLEAGGSSCTLQNATDDDGVALPSGTYFFTVDGDNSQKEHIMATLSGTSLTSIYSVSRQGVQTANAVREHRIGASIAITNFAHIAYLYQASKDYTDSVVIAGGVDASSTVKGISKLSLDPVSATEPIAVGDNDPRIPSTDENDALAGTSGTPSSSNKYVTADDVATSDTDDKIVRQTSDKKVVWIDEAAASGDMVYFDGSNWQDLPKGTETQLLSQGANYPAWTDSKAEYSVNSYHDTNKITYTIPVIGNNTVTAAMPWTFSNASFTAANSGYGVLTPTNASNSTYSPNAEAMKSYRVRVKLLSATSAANYFIWGITNAASPTQIKQGFSVDSSGKLEAVSDNRASVTEITGITVTNFNDYAIHYVGSQVLFYVNGVLKATHSSTSTGNPAYVCGGGNAAYNIYTYAPIITLA